MRSGKARAGAEAERSGDVLRRGVVLIHSLDQRQQGSDLQVHGKVELVLDLEVPPRRRERSFVDSESQRDHQHQHSRAGEEVSHNK